MLREDFLQPMNLTQQCLADAMQIPYQRLNEIIRQRRGVSPSTALRLAKVLGTSPDFWLNLQLRWDLYHALQTEQKQLDKLQPLNSPTPLL
jgi:addiction module HigA family antidote